MQAEIDLKLLILLEENTSLSQRQLADRLGISLGKTNYCLKASKEKGLVKWGNFSKSPNKLQYVHLLTPKGIRQKLSLTIHILESKQAEFECLNKEIVLLQAELRPAKTEAGSDEGFYWRQPSVRNNESRKSGRSHSLMQLGRVILKYVNKRDNMGYVHEVCELAVPKWTQLEARDRALAGLLPV